MHLAMKDHDMKIFHADSAFTKADHGYAYIIHIK